MERRPSLETDIGFVPFFHTGESVKGEFHCSDCAHGVMVCRTLPRCPSCGGETWEQTAWSPFLHTATTYAQTSFRPPTP